MYSMVLSSYFDNPLFNSLSSNSFDHKCLELRVFLVTKIRTDDRGLILIDFINMIVNRKKLTLL